jgi:Co/Zn/Cd efflux system component
VKESIFKQIASLVRDMIKEETTTTAGRINILGMVLSLILAVSLSLAPLFETLVRLFHPNESVGAPLVPIFVIFCLFTIICASMIGYLERPHKDQASGSDRKDRHDHPSDPTAR